MLLVRRVERTLFPSCHCTCLLNYEVPVVSIYAPLSEMLFCWGWKLLLLNCFPRAPTFTLQPLYNRIKSSLGTETKPCLLLIDDLTALLSVGVPLQQITNFIHYCAALMCHSPTVVCNVSKYHLKTFDLEWGWRWPCCDRGQYLVSMITNKNLHLRSSNFCIITRSPLASLLFKGLATKHVTVKLATIFFILPYCHTILMRVLENLVLDHQLPIP